MHIFDLVLLLYIVIWMYGALVILREARQQPMLVRMMTLFAIVLGPLAMLLYLGIRFVAHAAAVGRALPSAQHMGRLH